MVAIILEVSANAVTTVGQPLPADTLAVNADSIRGAGVVTDAAMPVSFQDTAAGVTAGQLRGALLGATPAVIVVRSEIGADSAAAALPRRAAFPIAAIGVVRADRAIRAARRRIGVDVDTKTLAVR